MHCSWVLELSLSLMLPSCSSGLFFICWQKLAGEVNMKRVPELMIDVFWCRALCCATYVVLMPAALRTTWRPEEVHTAQLPVCTNQAPHPVNKLQQDQD